MLKINPDFRAFFTKFINGDENISENNCSEGYNAITILSKDDHGKRKEHAQKKMKVTNLYCTKV